MTQETKKMVEGLIDNLKKRGINVIDAAVLNLGDKSNTKDADIEKAVRDFIKKGMQAQAAKQTPKQPEANNSNKENTEKTEKEQCYCPGCFNFETFEEVLSKQGGQFDYVTVELLGKKFDIKYWIGENDEHLIVEAQEEHAEENEELTAAQLQEELNLAVQNKNYDKAQSLLNALNNKIKNN